MYSPAASGCAHLPFRIGGAVHADGFEDHVGEDPVNAFAHLGAEPGHDAVDHDHRGHPEHHADDAGQRDIARLEIAGAEQEFVHEPVLGGMEIRKQRSVGSGRAVRGPPDDPILIYERVSDRKIEPTRKITPVLVVSNPRHGFRRPAILYILCRDARHGSRSVDATVRLSLVRIGSATWVIEE